MDAALELDIISQNIIFHLIEESFSFERISPIHDLILRKITEINSALSYENNLYVENFQVAIINFYFIF